MSTLVSIITACSLVLSQGGGGRPGGAASGRSEGPQDYATVIKDHDKKDGVFKVYTKGETILFEIPKDKLGREFFWYTELRKAPSGSYSGASPREQVLRWEQRGDKVLLRTVDYSIRARDGGAIGVAVLQANYDPIIATFDVRARAENGDPVIDATRLYKTDIPELTSRAMSGSIDAERTFLEKVVAFPENVNVEVLVTTRSGGGAAPTGGGGGRGGGAGAGRASTSAIVHYGLVLLPEKPMMGRLADSRVGYFATGFTDFGTEYHGTKEFEFISRHRLEKKDPNQPVSEPVEPIVYYVPKEVPEKWREYVKKGIEDWQPAFEAAGFRNAIIAKDQPDDPNWSPEDVRYNVIRWVPLPIRNAMGPSVTDPRSGEILSAHVLMYHDSLKLVTDWYFAQASGVDPRAQKLPFPDDLTGECLRFVVAHEVGHTLGLHHNGKSSAMVPVALLRDKKWTHENGTAASIMDYARFNYVAQPGDGANMQPKIGPYDKWAIMWGYKPILSATTPWEELDTTDEWAAQQVDNPLLRFHNNYNSADPTALSETLGDDAVAASNYGTANLKRSMGILLKATTKLGEDYSELSRYHGQIASQFGNYINHVTSVVGGVELIDYRAGRGGETYIPAAKADQQKSVKWLMDNVLRTPQWLIPSDVLYRIGSDAGTSRVNGLYSRVIGGLLQDGRLDRMRANTIKQGSNAYTVEEMADTIRGEVWQELGASAPVVDTYRMGLQQSYVNILINKLTPTNRHRGLALVEIESSLEAVKGALPKVRDRATKGHLMNLQNLLHLALTDPSQVLPQPTAGAVEVPAGFPRRNACPEDCTIRFAHEHVEGCCLGGIVKTG